MFFPHSLAMLTLDSCNDRSANERQDKTALGIRAAGDDKHPC